MIVLANVTKRFGPKILFENVTSSSTRASATASPGANGAGKSTLLEMIARQEDWDAGSIDIPPALKIGVLEQNHFAYDEQRILDTVMAGKAELWEAMVEKEKLLAGEVDDDDRRAPRRARGRHRRARRLHRPRARRPSSSSGLGIPAEKHLEPDADAARRLQAARPHRQGALRPARRDAPRRADQPPRPRVDPLALAASCVDEFKGTLLVVSHDRHFLNSVATHMADVDYQTITIYTGNYDDFVAAKYENQQRAEATAQSAKKKIGELQDFVQRFGSHASKSKQAQSRLKQIEKLEDVVETKGAKRSSLVRPFVRFEIEKPSGRDVLRASTGTSRKAFERTKVVLDGVSLNLNRGDSIAVIGRSGIGKSTLLKLIVGAYKQLDAETQAVHARARRGRDPLGPRRQRRLLRAGPPRGAGRDGQGHDAVRVALPLRHHAAPRRRSAPSSGGCSSAARRRSSRPRRSPAARRRACSSARWSSGEHNVLVLDEPTNHLDIESIEGLLEGLLRSSRARSSS